MTATDSLCDSLARMALMSSQEVTRLRNYMAESRRCDRDHWDRRAASAEGSMIDRANRLIEIRSR